ncbi:MAG: protease modulator HflC [Steroidobacteraceae bacterium]|nr:protease modulator HflC [Steroidobacteraceae bacterium]
MNRLLLGVASVLVVLFVVMSSAFVIDQSEQGIVVQFGEPVGSVITEPGLHWRVPFIQEVRRFDKRLLAWDGDVSQIPTLGREFVIVDTTARWRIRDPLQFLRSVRDEQGARSRLDDILDSVVRDIVSGTEIEEIVRSADWRVNVEDLPAEEGVEVKEEELERPRKGRAVLEQEMLTAAARQTPDLGIELVDVRIKRINYIDSVRAQVESRMIAERQSIAARFRAEGQGRSQEILGDMERQIRTIRSEAERTAQTIIGKADAEATRIYGAAYSADPEFYSFFKTLESYKALGENTTLMIDAQSDYFRYLQNTRRR